VFSEMTPSSAEGANDPFSQQSGAEAVRFGNEVARSMPRSSLMDLGEGEMAGLEPPLSARQARAHGRSVREGMTSGGARPVIAFNDEEAANAAALRRKQLIRRVPILVGVALLLIGAVWAGLWF